MRDQKQKSGSGGIIRIVIAAVLFFVLALLVTTMIWCMGYWHDITVDEILFHLNAPIEGTAENVMTAFYLKALLPAVIVVVVFAAGLVLLRKRGKLSKVFKIGAWVAAGLAFVITLVLFCNQYGVVRYIRSRLMSSDFISSNYVDPQTVNITFPEQKRNLIYIYCESMEITYADTASGGASEQNVIPELTELAMENECFAGDSGFLDGGYVTTGTTYTMSALLAQTAGIPINSDGSIGNAASSYADSFYPGATVLGDILADAGYNQEFMCGSVAYFGGRELYFEGHGGYKIFDYKYASTNDYIPRGYKVWWGYEDSKMFEFAKSEILELASQDAPFNFTMLTADTHFEDGYLCDKCGNEFGDQYSNVMKCSSEQVYEFVEWAKQQDFYENTTIIICGDHTTMDSDYCENVPEDYVRKTYVCVINPACSCETSDRREYTTLDMFPTTLAALGCEIEGDRLGLGTNLFSSRPTLIEEYGAEYLDSELGMKTDFYDSIGQFDYITSDIMKHLRYLDIRTSLSDDGMLDVSFWGIENGKVEIASARGEFYSGDILAASCDFTLGEDKTYTGSFDLSQLSFRDVFCGTMKIYVTDVEGVEHTAFVNDDNISVLSCEDLSSYLEMLAGMDDMTVLVAVKDEASTNLTAADVQAFEALGVPCDLMNAFGYSYYAVAGGGLAEAEVSNEMLQTSGVLCDGTPYEITSAGAYNGKVCSIEIDNVEYAPNTRGFNFVVYDNLTGTVVDCRAYDVYDIGSPYFLTDETVEFTYSYEPGSNALSVYVGSADIELLSAHNPYVYIYIWSGDKPAENNMIVLTKGEDSEGRMCFTADDISLAGYDPTRFGIMLFVKCQDTGFVDYKCKVYGDITA